MNGSPLLARFVIPDMPPAAELMRYMKRLDTQRWYSNYGPLVTEFESRLHARFAARDPAPAAGAISLTTISTGYHALVLGLKLLGLSPGAQVLVPAVTFPACPLAVQEAGCTPLFADIDADNWTLTPKAARRIAAQHKIAAVMPVAVYGVAVDGWDEFAKETGIPVLIDAAAALDVQPVPHRCLVAYSLHATKPFGVGEGGLLVSRDADLIARAKLMTNFGTRDRITMCDGTNAKMSEYHGAVALAQLDRWESVKERRARVFDLYRRALSSVKANIRLQPGIERAIVSVFMLKLGKPIAEAVLGRLKEQGYGAHRMYLPPLYRHPHFAGTALADTEGKHLGGSAEPEARYALMVNSEMMNRHVFGLPFNAFLGENETQIMAEALAGVLQALSP